MNKPKKPVIVASSNIGSAVLGPVNGSGVVLEALEPATVTAYEMALFSPEAVAPSIWSVCTPLPIAEGIVTEPSRMPLASLVNVFRSLGVEKAHTSTEVLGLNPDPSTRTAVPACTVTLPASAVTLVLNGNTMHKAPATKGLATVVDGVVAEVVVVAAGALEHARTPCVPTVTTASTEVPSADVTRPLPDSAAGAVGDTNGVSLAAAVVVAPVFVVVELTGAVVELVVVVPARVVVVPARVVVVS